MTEQEKWYRFCMICKHSYKRVDDADGIYCELPGFRFCPHKKEIEQADRRDNEPN